MAKYNEIFTGRHNRFIQKLFGMKGMPPAPQLSGDIQISHPLFHGHENRFIESWQTWGASAVIAANAGNVCATQVRILPTAGVLAVIEKLVLWTTGVAEECDLSETTTLVDLTSIVAPSGRDGRIVTTSGSPIIVSHTNVTVGNGTIFHRAFIPPNLDRDLILFEDQQITLIPGFTFRVQATVANQNLGYTWWWRERVLEESEKA